MRLSALPYIAFPLPSRQVDGRLGFLMLPAGRDVMTGAQRR